MQVYLCEDERPWWISTRRDGNIYVGGGLDGMNYTMIHHAEIITDPGLLFYDCVEDFICYNIEYALTHEVIHQVLREHGCSEEWDNVDSSFEISNIYKRVTPTIFD